MLEATTLVPLGVKGAALAAWEGNEVVFLPKPCGWADEGVKAGDSTLKPFLEELPIFVRRLFVSK